MRSEQVQKELGVSVQQKETVDEWVAAYREQSRALRGARRGLRDLSSDEREKKSAEFRAKRKALVEEAERKLASLLTPAQMNRLDEIALQQRGAEALVDPEVSRAVKLTEEQSASIKMILEMRGKEQRKLWEKGRGGAREGIREKMRQLRRDAEAQALAVLTDVQKNELKVLRGAPFELDRKSLRSGDRSGPGADGRKGDGGKRRGSPADDSEA